MSTQIKSSRETYRVNGCFICLHTYSYPVSPFVWEFLFYEALCRCCSLYVTLLYARVDIKFVIAKILQVVSSSYCENYK